MHRDSFCSQLSTISFKLPILGLKYYLLLSFPIKQLFVPPFSLSLTLWCRVWLRPDSSAMDCLHVSLTLQDSGSAPLTLKAGEFSLCEESITSADTLLLALTSSDSRWRLRCWGDGREFEEDGEGGCRGSAGQEVNAGRQTETIDRESGLQLVFKDRKISLSLTALPASGQGRKKQRKGIKEEKEKKRLVKAI